MKHFLEYIAHDIQAYGRDLSRVLVIFPNKRAGLFLNEYLVPKDGEHSLWAPTYKAVDEFIKGLSPLETADPIETICRLYRHYVRHTGSTETLDAFYCWGERILADFDDLDKSMAPANELFKNLCDYEEIGADMDDLDSEEIEQFQRFVGGFKKGENTEIRSRFLRLWNALPQIYTDLRNELAEEGLAYEGQLYREVAEQMESGELHSPNDYSHIVVVGLNVLNKAERTILKALEREGKALFYWDYDTYYAHYNGNTKNEAGIFIEQDLLEFPNSLKREDEYFNNFLKDRTDGKRTVEYIEAPTEAAQAEYVAKWLSDPRNFNPDEPRETAVVLCNEALLQPVLYALPSCVREVNVTKGFPLGHTPAYASLVKHAEELSAKQKGKPELTGAEFIARLQEIIMQESAQFCKESETGDKFMHMLCIESYYKVYTTLSRFANLIEKNLLTVSAYTLFRLLRQTMSQMSIPFHGEPASGLQIMGVLETRCLDFKHVLMLSVGEGYLPQKATENSFIPYLLRRHFGLTTSEHKTSVYAYYFYRLLQRAEHVTLTYNTSTEGMRKGEMSRFMLALLIDGKVPIERYRLNSTPHPETHGIALAWKPKNFAEKVMKKVSPSKINAYMRCQMAFYFKYVLGIPEETAEEAIISRTDFGTVVHKAAELFYGDLQAATEGPILPSALKEYVGKEGSVTLLSYVRKAYEDVNEERTKENEKIARGESSRSPQPLLVRTSISEQAILRYLKLIVRFESGANEGQTLPAQAFKVLAREVTKHVDLDVPYGDGTFRVRLEGNIDRLDKALLNDGQWHLRIVDYKTGGHMEDVKYMDQLFEPGTNHPHYAFQTFLYALTLMDESEGLPIAPSLIYAGKSMNKDYTPYIKFEDEPMLDFATIANEFRDKFVELLQNMLDASKPFRCADSNDPCRTCAFTAICARS